ncbi:MAG: rRNA methyltransferase [Anaerolineae bacterium]|nr:rRNA methyltransferase [Anaerolineae bacterium]
MDYRFAVERPDYSHLASGHVFYNLPGYPAFPVRLASEIFQRCLDWRRRAGETAPCTLFDPCCGAAYGLGVVAFLHRDALREVIGADVDVAAVECARRNLSLLTLEGLEWRRVELETLLARFGKASHQEALHSAALLQKQLLAQPASMPLVAWAFQADATHGEVLSENLGERTVDVVFSDVPYGQRSHWKGDVSSTPLVAMLEALLAVLAPAGLVAIAADKSVKPAHPGYRRLEQFQVGKRRIAIFQAL